MDFKFRNLVLLCIVFIALFNEVYAEIEPYDPEKPTEKEEGPDPERSAGADVPMLTTPVTTEHEKSTRTSKTTRYEEPTATTTRTTTRDEERTTKTTKTTKTKTTTTKTKTTTRDEDEEPTTTKTTTTRTTTREEDEEPTTRTTKTKTRINDEQTETSRNVEPTPSNSDEVGKSESSDDENLIDNTEKSKKKRICIVKKD
ncbi:hypothetical protein H8356DRAFT_1617141 [Neocallimastix lanati (nom. inval.)]|jgi:FtsZ-interacting cell division protein ZipA|uniref:Uncharacterized protein n=1 Tax=Neocallimastix californiae TaxID=1754190 RepID=A0A1Y2FRJ9_9FUNG|nr:hypothetical protein H8356DRAFT_1617141 [Neocallimastix sp. JGI-2020a]ORY86569.1 hypothetical protein LY90DRAFT_696857 [Neocallimastix californiae]|eukprot:ORY86569.1 hypothetical protein LY90DRAFT_696857 [Neocallimastix californiae]